MVTYEDILQAWERWHATGSKRDWDALWLLTQERMGTLIKTSIRGRRVDDDDLHDMITGATCSVMDRFRAANYADLAWVRSRLCLIVGQVIVICSRKARALNREVGLDDIPLAVDIMQKPCQA